MKFIKKFFKYLLYLILLIIVLLILIPIVFKGKIMEKAKAEINKNIRAKVEFVDLKLSLFKKFPNASIQLDGLCVEGIDDFEGDTLLTLNSLQVTVDIISAIKMENIKVKGITLDNPDIAAIVLEDGRPNWDIAIPAEEQEEIDTVPSEPMEFHVDLKKFEIKSADISYDDRSSGMFASLDNFNFMLKGDLGADHSLIEINSSTEFVNVIMGGIKYVKNAALNINVNLDADLANSVFTLKENTFTINDLTLLLDGSVAMPDTQNIDIDMKFNTSNTSFKSLLSMVPAVYMKDFEDVQTSGNLLLEGYAKGRLNDKTTPSAGIKLMVENAMFKYPDLPKSVENININVDVFWDGEDNDKSVVDINKFHLEIAQNPVDILLKVTTPISDPDIKAKLTGNINMATMADVVPMEGSTLTGQVSSNVEMMGRMSMIENERYEDFKADGNITLSGIDYKSEDFPQGVMIQTLSLDFSPQFVTLGAFDANIGKSDIHLNGKITEFIPYLFSDGIVKADFAFSSNYLDLNEFTGEETTETPEAEETTTSETETAEIPKNIDFKLTTQLKKVLFDKLSIDNITGIITVKEGKALMQNLSIYLLQGSMILNGEYNTQDMSKPFVDFGMNISNFDIPSAFQAFSFLQEYAPVAENATGKFSTTVALKSDLDQHMSPVMNSVYAKGNLKSNSVSIQGSNTLNKLGDALKTDKFKTMKVTDVDINYEIKDGRIYLEPFTTQYEQAQLGVFGDQGIDQTMNYTMNINMPRSQLGSGANQVLDNLSQKAASQGLNIQPSETVNIEALVGGTFSDPTVTLNLKESATNMVEDVKEQVKEKVKEEVKEQIDDAKQKASAEAEKIMQKAEQEAENIKKAAKASADQVRQQSEASAKKIENEAKGKPKLMQEAAKKSADKVRKEGDDKAKKIEQEGNQKADAVIQKARAEADKLK